MFLDIFGAIVAPSKFDPAASYVNISAIASVDGKRQWVSINSGNAVVLDFVAKVLAPAPTPANPAHIATPVRIELPDGAVVFERLDVKARDGSTKSVVNGDFAEACQIAIVGAAQGMGPTGWVDKRAAA